MFYLLFIFFKKGKWISKEYVSNEQLKIKA